MFGLFESSRAKGKPIELYKFQYGPAPTDVKRYTNAEEDQIVSGETYVSVSTDRDKVTISTTADNNTFELRFAKNLDLLPFFLFYPPEVGVRLTVFEGHVGDTDFPTFLIGTVAGFSINGSNQLSFTIQRGRARKPGLFRNYQIGCRHDLFGS